MGRVIFNRCVSLPTTTYSFNQQMVGITSVFILVDDVTGFLFGICCWMVEHFKKLEDSVQVCIGTANERICIRKRETNRSNGRENGTKPMFFAKKQWIGNCRMVNYYYLCTRFSEAAGELERIVDASLEHKPLKNNWRNGFNQSCRRGICYRQRVP